MKVSRSLRFATPRPGLLLVAAAVVLAGLGERALFGRPEPAAPVNATAPVTTIAATATVAKAAPMATIAKVAAVSAATLPAATTPAVTPPAAAESAAPSELLALETVTGEASYYAQRFEGRRTASGAPFRNADLVAAHRRYPFGTVLRVTNAANGRSVEVTVVDRGPYAGPGRILDLSRAAAERLDYVEQGHADVTVEVLTWGESSGG